MPPPPMGNYPNIDILMGTYPYDVCQLKWSFLGKQEQSCCRVKFAILPETSKKSPRKFWKLLGSFRKLRCFQIFVLKRLETWGDFLRYQPAESHF
jgi:hypothetical protein